jgi:hypothetical protein
MPRLPVAHWLAHCLSRKVAWCRICRYIAKASKAAAAPSSQVMNRDGWLVLQLLLCGCGGHGQLPLSCNMQQLAP